MACNVDFATGGTTAGSFLVRYNGDWEKGAQGFQVTLGTDICKVSIELQKYASPTGNIWVEIWSYSGGNPSSVISNGVSDTKDVSTISTSATWYDFTFSTDPTVTKSTYYFVVIRGSWAVSLTNYVRVITSSTTANPGPMSYRTSVSQWYDRGALQGYGDLKMEVWTDYTTTSIKKVSGVEHASIKKIGGVAIGSVKKIAGVE